MWERRKSVSKQVEQIVKKYAIKTICKPTNLLLYYKLIPSKTDQLSMGFNRIGGYFLVKFKRTKIDHVQIVTCNEKNVIACRFSTLTLTE